VAGFTSLSEKLDPEDVHRIMDGGCRSLLDEIHRFEGTVGEFREDGVMALFGAPVGSLVAGSAVFIDPDPSLSEDVRRRDAAGRDTGGSRNLRAGPPSGTAG